MRVQRKDDPHASLLSGLLKAWALGNMVQDRRITLTGGDPSRIRKALLGQGIIHEGEAFLGTVTFGGCSPPHLMLEMHYWATGGFGPPSVSQQESKYCLPSSRCLEAWPGGAPPHPQKTGRKRLEIGVAVHIDQAMLAQCKGGPTRGGGGGIKVVVGLLVGISVLTHFPRHGAYSVDWVGEVQHQQ